MAEQHPPVRFLRWPGPQHPTLANITRQLQQEGYRPYSWNATPNHRYAVCCHGYAKVIYVITGMVEFTFPETNEMVKLRAGDRIEIPAGVRHGIIICNSGAQCVEASHRLQPTRTP